MTFQELFKMEISDMFGISGRGIVFEGIAIEGKVSLGDKLEYFENDGTKILAVVKKIIVKEKTKIFWIFPSTTGKEIQVANQGQQASVMVGDFFNVARQCNFSPSLGEGSDYLSKVSKKTLQSFMG